MLFKIIKIVMKQPINNRFICELAFPIPHKFFHSQIANSIHTFDSFFFRTNKSVAIFFPLMSFEGEAENDKRTNPGEPNASPGTKANPASNKCSQNFSVFVSILVTLIK